MAIVYVTFSPDDNNARPPGPQLLALHAACAQVVRMPGAAEFFDELERDVEETRIRASNGSSARLLNYLMSPFAVVPWVT